MRIVRKWIYFLCLTSSHFLDLKLFKKLKSKNKKSTIICGFLLIYISDKEIGVYVYVCVCVCVRARVCVGVNLGNDN